MTPVITVYLNAVTNSIPSQNVQYDDSEYWNLFISEFYYLIVIIWFTYGNTIIDLRLISANKFIKKGEYTV